MSFLKSHHLAIHLEVFYQLWPAQGGSKIGLIYQLWPAQKQPSPVARWPWAGPLASLGFAHLCAPHPPLPLFICSLKVYYLFLSLASPLLAYQMMGPLRWPQFLLLHILSQQQRHLEWRIFLIPSMWSETKNTCLHLFYHHHAFNNVQSPDSQENLHSQSCLTSLLIP